MVKERTLQILLSALRVYWSRILLTVRSADVLLIAVGIGALFIGIIVDELILRLLCLAVILATGVLVYRSVPRKETLFQPLSKREEMKKLIFDDFQSTAAKEYKIGEVFEPIPEKPAEEVPPAPAVRTTPTHGFVIIKPEVKPASKEFQISDFFDVDSDIFTGETEPRTEFDFLLNKVLSLIKDVVFANSAVFFWANREKQQMVIEERITDSSAFMSSRRFPMGQDLVSKVADTGKPELITEVNPLSESELLRYYDSPAAIKSFAGVPVYFSKLADPGTPGPVGVIAVDSTVEGTFGQETLSLLGQFTKLVSALIKSYTDKYDLLLDSELLAAQRRFRERTRSDSSLASIQQAFAEEVSKLVGWDFMTIILCDEKQNSWVARKVVNRAYEPYIAPEQVIDFPGSVAGQTIKNNMQYAVDDIEKITLPRFHAGEKTQSKGSLISVPISSLNRCYGALVIENRTKGFFSKQDVATVTHFAEYIALSVEIVAMNDVIKEYVIVDDVTGAYAKKFFLQRIDEELQRADDTGSELSLLLVTVDHSTELAQRFSQEGFDRIMGALAKAVRSSVRKYDIVGRIDYNRFGVALLNTTANEAYLWAEKIRKNVAAHVITLDEKSFSITISVGVSGALEGMKKEELIANTVTVLHKASEAGGNSVRVF